MNPPADTAAGRVIPGSTNYYAWFHHDLCNRLCVAASRTNAQEFLTAPKHQLRFAMSGVPRGLKGVTAARRELSGGGW
jgi:hypothetical protein